MSTTDGVNPNQSVAASASTSASSTNTTKTTGSNSLDKNAFLKILMAEISNQDPTSQNNDPTQYVSQLAQYSSLEQMTNLNATMTLNGASDLIGKNVQFNKTDVTGKNIEGIVKSVSKNGDLVTLNVQVPGSSDLQQYSYSNIVTINPEATATPTPTTPADPATKA